ncbi:hypothetical protein [Caldisphaera sp.]|mgnify:CR=1 FL=1|uniref:hypothetical protein n=1 Tax=Caldisphaera sp. TaxID=2060322 RepID=UPI0025BA83B4|nr:hypothetical protein [Caldisphaera sp.]
MSNLLDNTIEEEIIDISDKFKNSKNTSNIKKVIREKLNKYKKLPINLDDRLNLATSNEAGIREYQNIKNELLKYKLVKYFHDNSFDIESRKKDDGVLKISFSIDINSKADLRLKLFIINKEIKRVKLIWDAYEEDEDGEENEDYEISYSIVLLDKEIDKDFDSFDKDYSILYLIQELGELKDNL